jgi:hypothetical protein
LYKVTVWKRLSSAATHGKNVRVSFNIVKKIDFSNLSFRNLFIFPEWDQKAEVAKITG